MWRKKTLEKQLISRLNYDQYDIPFKNRLYIDKVKTLLSRLVKSLQIWIVSIQTDRKLNSD